MAHHILIYIADHHLELLGLALAIEEGDPPVAAHPPDPLMTEAEPDLARATRLRPP